MKTKLTIKETAALASMLFGLFFGAGNLIFPAHMGQLAGSKAAVAAAGFILTGVGLPLLGVAAMGKARCEGLQELSSRVGRGWSVFFTCLLYLTIGPFFAIPRCATTSFTIGIEPFLQNLPVSGTLCLFIFSVFFFAPVLFFSLKPGKLLTWIGKVINPVFLLFLGVLLLVAFLRPMGSVSAAAPEETYRTGAFLNGFLEGYNTMDALAALAFGIVIIRVVRTLGVTEPGAVAGCTLKAGVFCCLMMGVIYALITLMGAQSLGRLTLSENGGVALAEIAEYYFGGAGQLLLAVTVFLACLKTSIGLVTGCAETFAQMFPRVSYRGWTVIFSVLSLVISNAGLTTLITYSLPVLMFLYPLAITLILLSLAGELFQNDRRVYVSVTAFTAIAAFFDLLRALPENIQLILHTGAVTKLASVLPLYSQGLGWICPALAGLAVGLLWRWKMPQTDKTEIG